MESNRGKIKIVQLDWDNMLEVAKIEKICFSEPWSLNAFEEEINNKNAYFRVAVIDSKVVGYVGMQFVICEGYITNLAVAPNYRKLGVGTVLLQDCIMYASKNEFEFISLEVRVSNTVAINLYSSQGFEICGSRKNFYKKPDEDAYIMTKYILKSEDV